MPSASQITCWADRVEKYSLAILFLMLLTRMQNTVPTEASFINLLYLLDQLIVLTFCLIRRPAIRMSTSVVDWSVAFAASFLPLMVVPASGEPLVPLSVAAGLLLFGTGVHLWAKLVMRRSFGVVAAQRVIKVSGPYRIVRHPMYTGYILTEIALLLAGPNAWNVLIIVLVWALQLVRINREERFLSHQPDYDAYLLQVRYRLWPGIY